MKHEQTANEIYWAMEHGDTKKVDNILEELFYHKELLQRLHGVACNYFLAKQNLTIPEMYRWEAQLEAIVNEITEHIQP
jgi:hypothetical protein